LEIMRGRIGIVVAMAAELRHLLAWAGDVRETRDRVWQEYHFCVDDLPVIALRSGIGLLNAAAATEHLIAFHAPTIVLNVGCAGAHRRDLLPGDIVIGERVVHTSAVHILPDGTEHHVGAGYEVDGERVAAASVLADARLVALAQETAQEYRPQPWPDHVWWPADIARRAPRIVTGAVASADIWTQALDRLDDLHRRHGTLCEDMEAAAIAQGCARYGIPFLTIKDISNNEYHRASDVITFADFPIHEVGKRAAGLAVRFIQQLALDEAALAHRRSRALHQ
jgi:adenosylhomocysteine nucleosidase